MTTKTPLDEAFFFDADFFSQAIQLALKYSIS